MYGTLLSTYSPLILPPLAPWMVTVGGYTALYSTDVHALVDLRGADTSVEQHFHYVTVYVWKTVYAWENTHVKRNYLI